MPPERANSAFTVAVPARKRSRQVKSSEGSAGVVQHMQPQEVSAEVLPQALLEQIVSKVSDEVTRLLSSTSGDRNANDHQIPDQISEVPVTGNAAGADQISEVPAVGIPADSPGRSVIQGSVSQFQERLSRDLPTTTPLLPSALFTSSLFFDARVPAKLQVKILKNEFIDFGALATNHTLQNKYQLVLQNGSGTRPPSLALQPVTKTRKFFTISSWMSSFIFVRVYTS